MFAKVKNSNNKFTKDKKTINKEKKNSKIFFLIKHFYYLAIAKKKFVYF